MCKLLENVYYTIHDKIIKVERFENGFAYWDQNGPTRMLAISLRPLTIDEKVDYLYSLALHGSAKEYREICHWVGVSLMFKYEGGNAEAEYTFHLKMQTSILTNSKAFADECIAAVKDLIKQALAEQNKK